MLSTKPSSTPHQQQQQQQQDFLQITHDKFYSRLLSKDTSLANPSFRVYYGGASGAVPFLWESRPGTPKNTIPTSTLPPLTPPPSYHSSPKKHKNTTKKFSAIHSMLPKLMITTKKTNLQPSVSSPLVSLSSTSSVSSSQSSTGSHRRSRFSSPRSSFADEEDLIEGGSPTSTLCFGVRKGGSGGMKGCYSLVIMKNALLSIAGVGHGHGSSTNA